MWRREVEGEGEVECGKEKVIPTDHLVTYPSQFYLYDRMHMRMKVTRSNLQ